MRITLALLSASTALTTCHSARGLDGTGAAEPSVGVSNNCGDVIYVLGEFNKRGEFPYAAGMTALDALEMAERTDRYRKLVIMRDRIPVQVFLRSATREDLSQFRLEPCDKLVGYDEVYIF